MTADDCHKATKAATEQLLMSKTAGALKDCRLAQQPWLLSQPWLLASTPSRPLDLANVGTRVCLHPQGACTLDSAKGSWVAAGRFQCSGLPQSAEGAKGMLEATSRGDGGLYQGLSTSQQMTGTRQQKAPFWPCGSPS